jgi:hypothetical protein
MQTRAERITSATALIVLGAITAAGAAVAIVGLATSSAGDDGARRAYIAGLIAAAIVGVLLAVLIQGRRRALAEARVRAGDLERQIDLALKGRGDTDDPLLRAAGDDLVVILLRAGAYRDAERLALAMTRLKEPPLPVRLGAAS